jgi:hypothetical protein
VDPVEKAIRAVEQAAGKPASDGAEAARSSRTRSASRGRRARNKRWIHVWREGRSSDGQSSQAPR